KCRARRHRNARHAYLDGLAPQPDRLHPAPLPLIERDLSKLRSSPSAALLPNPPATRYYPTAHPLRGFFMKRFLQLTFTLAAILVAAQTAAAQEWSQPWARERIAKS